MATMMSDDFILEVPSVDNFKMWQGLAGPYYIPSVDENGVLSWTNTGDLPNPDSVDISGPAGASFSIAGIVEDVSDLPVEAEGVWLVGEEAPYEGYSFVDGAWADIGQFAIGPQGPQGNPGQDGSDGSDGAAAGFGTPTATITNTTGTPGVTVTASGPDTAKVFAFAFTNLKGAKGDTGPAGTGIPTGGTTGQVLAKKSGTNYDTEWVNQSGGGGSGTVQSVNDVQPDQNGNITLTADDIETDNNQSIQDDLDDLSDAIGNVVHVGTSAPSDPSVKIWLDTDEPGMSAVSSVNSKTGTVVLDAEDIGAMSEWNLLWTNASPTSAFGEVDISLNLTDYDAVYITYNHGVSGVTPDNVYSHIVVKGGSYGAIQLLTPSSNSTAWITRTAVATNTGVSFSTGELRVQGSAGTPGSRDTYLIPQKIWGIKGMVTV